MIQINSLYKQFSGQILFEDLSFNLQKGERCGLVGRNGSGKSTLFSIILDHQHPDKGDISIPKNYKLAHLEQHINFNKQTVLEECAQVLKGDEQFNTYKAEKILFGLGFTEDDLEKDPKSFSGGYQIRMNLCKSLLVEPNLLLLDEPTNYLDIVSLRWLKRFLNSFDGEVILITHDRDFMDSVTTHTMGLNRRQLKKIKGTTSKYYEQLIQEDEMYEKTRINQNKKRAHLESFVDRFSATASKATQAQSKVKQLQKMDVLGKLENDSTMGLKFNYKECPGKQLLEVQNISFGYKEAETLFSNISFNIGRNDKIGIIGKNGKGKSTLLNLIAGELKATQGEITSHPSLLKGHLGQTNVNRLSIGNNIIQEIQSVNTDMPQTAIRNICGSLMFEGETALKKISVLSGGEKNRVLLGKILANPTNLLLLDEPTNHLDMESIEILTDEIKEYPGAALIVTHSEAMLRKLVNKLIIFHKGGAELFLGTYDDFLEKIGWEEEIINSGKKENKNLLSKKEIHALRSEIIKERSKDCIPLKKELDKLEEDILQFEQKLEEQNSILEKASETGDNSKIFEASKQIGAFEENIQVSFDQMEELEEKLTSFNEIYDARLGELES